MVFPKTRTFKDRKHIKLERFSCTNLDSLDRTATVAMSGTARMVEKVKKPNQNDILLGRGGKNNQWIGNERLRNIARKHCQDYQKATKKVKSQISRKIVDKVRQLKPPGRFLRKCSATTDEWEDVGDIIAREKTSQVLRDAIQARKSFSGDGDRYTAWKKNSVDAERRKSPPQKVTKTPVKQSFQPSPQSIPVPLWRINPSLPSSYRTNNHVYPPTYSSMIRPSKPYGRVPISDFGNPLEDVPNYSNAASLPYHQYPVTPTSSSIALSTARKRARYSQESPLIQGYHKYPYPTPIRNVDPRSSSPSTPPVFQTPPNAKSRGLPFSSPDAQQNTHDVNPRRISTSQTVEKNHPAHETAHLPPPPEKSKVPLENRINDSQDLAALLNDDVLSDSDSKNNPTPLFTSNQDDLMFQNSF